MSQIEHHPQDDTLFSYAAGSLPAALALVVGCHLQVCSTCRSQVRSGESLGGELMTALAPKTLSDRARANVLQRLDMQQSQSDCEQVSVGSETIVSPAAPVKGAMPSLLQKILNDCAWLKANCYRLRRRAGTPIANYCRSKNAGA